MLWTEEEIELLKSESAKGVFIKDLVNVFPDRTEGAISTKLGKLKISLKEIRKEISLKSLTKTCKICEKEKNKSEYYLDKKATDGLYTYCKECVSKQRAEYHVENQSYILSQKEEYRENKRELLREKAKERWNNDPEHHKKLLRESYARHSEKRAKEKRDARKADPEHHREINRRAQEKIKNDPVRKEKYRQMHKKYYQENKEKIAEWERDYRNNNPQRKISTRLRNRINFVLRYNQKIEKLADTEELLGCSVEQVKDWMESQFTEDMTWDAFLAGEIHIDHIRPCASFDLTKKSEQLECFNWKNLQPLWAKDNLEKGTKIIDPTP